MFSLIITIIAIALVAALAVASIYYGGSAFTQGSAKASASTVVSQAQQISAANTLYTNDNAGTSAPDVATLVANNYLQSAPVLNTNITGGANLALNGTAVEVDIASVEVCQKINEQAGQIEADAMDATVDGVVDVAVVDQQFGCAWEDVDASTTLNTGDLMRFVYK